MRLRNSMLHLIPAIFACFLLVGPGARRVAAQETEMSSQAGLPDAARMHEAVGLIRDALRRSGGSRDAHIRGMIAAEIRSSYELAKNAASMVDAAPAAGSGTAPSAEDHLLRAQGARLRDMIAQLTREEALSAGERATLVALERKVAGLSAEILEIARIEDPDVRTQRATLLRDRLTPSQTPPSPTMWGLRPVSSSQRLGGAAKEARQ